MMTKRKKTPESTEAKVFDMSRRRCCLCLALDGDFGEKIGQISHLDRDPSNSNIDNLCFLCLDHHAKYDAKSRQVKSLKKNEVKEYRSRLYTQVTEWQKGIHSNLGLPGAEQHHLGSNITDGTTAPIEASTGTKSKLIWWILIPLIIGILIGVVVLLIEYGILIPSLQDDAPPTVTALLSETPPPKDDPVSCPQAREGDISISISEVMSIPRPKDEDVVNERYNEYVELVNYGGEAIDIGGFFLEDNNAAGQLISWNDAFPGNKIGETIRDSTCLAAGSYALVLPKTYDEGDMPYSNIPDSTIVLTFAELDFIGDGLTGIEGDYPLDALTLFISGNGGDRIIISTYGTPLDDTDQIPKLRDDSSNWGGFRMINIEGADSYSNWQWFDYQEGTPGY